MSQRMDNEACAPTRWSSWALVELSHLYVPSVRLKDQGREVDYRFGLTPANSD